MLMNSLKCYLSLIFTVEICLGWKMAAYLIMKCQVSCAVLCLPCTMCATCKMPISFTRERNKMKFMSRNREHYCHEFSAHKWIVPPMRSLSIETGPPGMRGMGGGLLASNAISPRNGILFSVIKENCIQSVMDRLFATRQVRVTHSNSHPLNQVAIAVN